MLSDRLRHITVRASRTGALVLLLASLSEGYRVPMSTGTQAAPSFRDVRGVVRTMPPEEDRDVGYADPHHCVETFQPRAFEAPWFATNCHFQTIWGARAIQEIFSKLVEKNPVPPNREWEKVYDRRERWNTPDDDVISVDFLFHEDPAPPGVSRPMVVVLHGLESSSSAVLPRSMSRAFFSRGFEVAAVNFRGCCGEENLKPCAYHLGFTDDLHFVLQRLHAMDPQRRLYLSGFSLGGNVILKCLGELGDDATNLGVCGASVACVPFDAVLSSSKIDAGFNGKVYAANFLSTLKPKAERKWEPGLYDLDRVRKVVTIAEFDDEVVAKLYNFENNVDYYRQSCSKQYLRHIRVPVMVVNAVDDPFIDERGLPGGEEIGEAPVRIVYHEHGGHCGFVTLEALTEGTREEDRWLPSELARFLHHAEGTFAQKAAQKSTA